MDQANGLELFLLLAGRTHIFIFCNNNITMHMTILSKSIALNENRLQSGHGIEISKHKWNLSVKSQGEVLKKGLNFCT